MTLEYSLRIVARTSINRLFTHYRETQIPSELLSYRRILKTVITFIIITGLSAGVGLMFGSFRAGRIHQPIEFNHKLHIHDVGLVCTDCHQHAEQLERAGIPNIARCADCHTDSAGVSSSAAQVVSNVLREEPIRWQRINALPKHVYFSHLRHVKLGRIECSRCHGPMGDLTSPPSKPYRSLQMNWCIECHDSRGISNDCLRCHR